MLKISTIMSLVFLIMLNYQVQAQKLSDMNEARDIAISELHQTLAQMPVGKEQAYGFNNRAEFANAKIDFVINESIGHDAGIEFSRYRFVVSVNGEARALLSYKKEGSSWIMCGFGAANLAREASIIAVNSKSGSNVAYLVRINDKSFKGDFIKFESSFKEEIPQKGLIPLVSSRESFLQKGIKSKDTYTLHEVLQLGLE